MIKLVAICLIWCGIVVIPNPPEKIEWINDYATALEVCRLQQDPLLVIIGDNPPILEDEFYEGYVCCFINKDTRYGEKVAGAFNVKEYPFAAVIDKTGSVVLEKIQGKITEKDWLDFLDKSRAGLRTHLFDMGGEKTYLLPYYCPHCRRSIIQ